MEMTAMLDSVKTVFEAATKHRLLTFLYPSKENGGSMKMRRVEPYSFRFPASGSTLLAAGMWTPTD